MRLIFALFVAAMAAQIVVEPGRVPETALSVSVASPEDDATEISGTVSLNGTVLAHNSTWVGVRFVGVAIPAGSVINSARVDYVAGATNTGVASFTIYGELVDSGTFTTGANNLSGRTLTAASVVWSPGNWTTLGGTYATSDITSIITEQITQGGWNNNVVLLIQTTTGNRRPAAFDNTTYAEPQLIIEYTEPTPTPTNTPEPPTSTNTPEPPTATNTPEPPTATNTPEPPTATNTPEPPTATNTPEPPTATNTPEPPTATSTPEPPTPTSTPESIYYVELPSGGDGIVEMTVTAGELFVLIPLIVLVAINVWGVVRDVAHRGSK